MTAKEHPGAAVGITMTAALFLMPGFFFPDSHTHPKFLQLLNCGLIIRVLLKFAEYYGSKLKN